jgi:hypothetical protein
MCPMRSTSVPRRTSTQLASRRILGFIGSTGIFWTKKEVPARPLPRFTRHMTDRQVASSRAPRISGRAISNLRQKLRLRGTVRFETTVHFRDRCQGKYGTVPDFRRAARRFVRNARRSVRRQVTNSLPCSLAMIVTILLA